MKIEHFAINVGDSVAVAAWYVEHCGLRVVRHSPERAETHFLSDGSGSVIEIYRNPPDQVPDYRSMNPLLLHLALKSADADADARRLGDAGSEVVESLRFDDGTVLIMMRDPWGLALQVCQRAVPLPP